jgi:prolyl oligopeptidase
MRPANLLLAAVFGGALLPLAAAAQAPAGVPPVAPVRPVVDDYHGTQVVDPYRYMENVQDPEVQVWMKAHADHTRATLDALPGRAKLLEHMREMWNTTPELVHSLRIVGGRYYTLRLPAGAKQEKLYVRDGVNGTDRLLIDPEQRSGGEEGLLSIQWYSPSPDHRYVAYSLAASGSEEGVMHILDTTTGQDLPETADRAGFGDPTWNADGRSFFYTRLQQLTPEMPPTEKYRDARVYLHEVGRSFDADPVVLGRGVNDVALALTPDEFPFIIPQPGSRYALAVAWPGVEPRVRIFAAPLADVASGKADWRPIAATLDEHFFIGQDDRIGMLVHGETLYWISQKDAPKGRILALDLTRADSKPRVVVPEGERPLSSLHVGRDALYWRVSDAGVNAVYRLRYDADAKPEAVRLPYPAHVIGVSLDPAGSDVVIGVSSWIRSPAYLSFDAQSGATKDNGLQPAGPHDRADDLTVEEVRVRSWDGTMVPLSIIYRTGLARDGKALASLDGYGAYGISSTPYYLPVMRALYDRGIVVATCHTRGGGELGKEWHRAGFQETKPNTWKDFIACAEYLVANGYTSPERLSASGGSAGGILVGRAIQERPDLFAAAVALVPLADMLRFETSANGPPNVPEFGSVATEAGFRALHAMSSYANVVDGAKYPALLVTTGINDPRVDAWIAAKFAARMQSATTSGKPVLLRVDYDAGHGIGSSIDQALTNFADVFSFALWQTGHPEFQPRQSAAAPARR